MEYARWPVGTETSESIFKVTICPLRNADLYGLMIITCRMVNEAFRRNGDTTCHTVREELLLLPTSPGFVSIIFLDGIQPAQAVGGKGKVHYSGPDKASRYGKEHHCLLCITSNSCTGCVIQLSSFQKCCHSLIHWKILYVTQHYYIDAVHLKILLWVGDEKHMMRKL